MTDKSHGVTTERCCFCSPPPRTDCGPVIRKKRGFYLIESAIVLGVVGLVIGGIWVAAASVNTERKLRQTEAGWLYYIDLFMKNFTATNSSSLRGIELHQWLEGMGSENIPAGWTAKRSSSGDPNTYHPTDPFGNRLYVSIFTDPAYPLSLAIGYNYQDTTVSRDLCARLMVLLFTRINPIYKISYINRSTGSCTYAQTTYSYYYNSCCVPGDSSVSASLTLPGR